jgi:nucleotide-binding universal stress UspA family protein
MFSEIPLPPSLINEAQNDAEVNMEKLVSTLKQKYKGLQITGKVIYGDIIHTIDEVTKGMLKPWLIVVGNSSPDNSSWPDSTLLDALKRLKFTVLAVPPETTYSPVRRICYAYDKIDKKDDRVLTKLKEITVQLNAELYVLNAQANKQGEDNPSVIDETARIILTDAKPQFHILHEENIDTAILDFASKNNIDWLILLPRKHSFFEGLFHKSHTKALAHNTHIPIVALHEEGA